MFETKTTSKRPKSFIKKGQGSQKNNLIVNYK